MDVDRDTPSRGDSSLSSAVGQQVQPSLPWITFNGSSDESSGDFVQSVQRMAFLQGRSDDDRWLAQYASTCFNGNALLWYSELEPETRSSWAMIRLALLRRYPRPPSPAPFRHQPPAPPQTQSSEASYVIKVLRKDLSSPGFVYFDRISGTTIITRIREKALRVGFMRGQTSSVGELHMTTSDDEKVSCLGVALLPVNEYDPDMVPEELVGIKKQGATWYQNVPEASPKCGDSGPDGSWSAEMVDMATWVLADCGEVGSSSLSCLPKLNNPRSEDRSAATVWDCTKNSMELRLKWPVGNGDECELGGFVQGGSSRELHFHRISDMTPEKVGEFIKDDRVTFRLEK